MNRTTGFSTVREIPKVEALLPPDNFFHPLQIDAVYDYARRGFRLLRNRSLEEINEGLAGLLWMFEYRGKELEERICALWDQSDVQARFSWAHILRLAMDNFDISEQPGFQNAAWSEYFGVLALAIYVSRIVSLWQDKRSTYSEPEQFEHFRNASYGMIDAGEALAIGETLEYADYLKSNVLLEVKNRISVRNRKASIKRHDKTNALLAELVRFYDSGRFTSYAVAVEEFIKQVDSNKTRHLAPTNMGRTLRNGLSAIKRGKRQL